MSVTEQLKLIEQNHSGHFVFLPKNLGFDVREISGVTVINCGMGTSMFNIAYGSPESPKTSDVIYEIKRAFAGQPFAWWIPPSQQNREVTETLLHNNLIVETVEHAMICDLSNVSGFVQKTNLAVSCVASYDLLQDFVTVLQPYDPHAQKFYEKMRDELFKSDEKLFVGYVDSRPVVIGILFLCGNSAGIFSVITQEEEQRKGYGTDMMTFLINAAKENKCQFVTLSASSNEGYRIYERFGFVKAGEFECFEYKGK